MTRMIRGIVASLVVTSLAAQSPSVDDLLAIDWRARNAAALALSKAATLDIAGLVRVMQTEWQGKDHPMSIYGDPAAPPPEPDPLRTMLRQLQFDLVCPPLRWPCEMQPPRDAGDLFVAWHPHQLALWLLTSRPSARDAATAAVAAVPLHGEALQRAWLLLAQPDAVAIAARFNDDEGCRSLALVLDEAPPRYDDGLRAGLISGSTAGRDAILRLMRPELASTPDTAAAVVDVFTTCVDENVRRHAGWTLLQLGAGAVPALAAKLTQAGEPRLRALGLLCLLGEHTSAASEALLELLDDQDRDVRLRALAALREAPLVASVRRQLAAKLLPWIAPRNSITGPFAIDVLGNLGDAADSTVITALRRCLDQPFFDGAAPRALGSLHRLGAVPDVPMETLRKLAAHPFANVHTWLALADRGEATPSLTDGRSIWGYAADSRWRDRELTACRLAITAPDRLRQWLPSDQPAQLRLAIAGLRTIHGADQVPTKDLVAALQHATFDNAEQLCEWLGERRDVAQHAEAVVAALEPMLRRGRWPACLHDLDPELVRAACKRWLAANPGDDDRDGLVAALVHLGMRGDEEIAAVQRVLGQGRCHATITALEEGADLPAALRVNLEQRMERDYHVADFRGATARTVLLHHRAR